eukprot:3392828-Pyramimonas_sp.AAC.1
MKTPWTIASTSDIVTSGLERKRDGTHAHVEARGKDCKLAEDYTDSFARQVNAVLARAASRACFESASTDHDMRAVAVFFPELGRVRRRPAHLRRCL